MADDLHTFCDFLKPGTFSAFGASGFLQRR